MSFDYDEAKRFFVNKLATDLEGKGRMESALYHTAKMIYEAGARDSDAALRREIDDVVGRRDAKIAELERFVQVAHEVHPNIDLDVAAHEKWHA